MIFPDLLDISIIQQNITVKRFIIIFIYALLAKAVDIFINRILRRLANLSKMEFDNQLIDLIHSPVYWTVFCVGILHALSIEQLPNPWQNVLPNLIKSIILMLWATTVFRAMSLTFNRNSIEIFIRKDLSNDSFNILKKLLRVIILIMCGVWLLTLWDIDLTPLFASAGIVGIAVAMAAKDTLANFFGGISIFMDNTFKEGDYIVLDSGERGEVVEIGMRSTRIKTRDDILITIPNSILSNTMIINESAPIPLFRIRIPVGVAYGTTPDRVEEILLNIAVASPKVINDPSPRVRFRGLGNSSIDFELLCWVKEPSQKGLVTHLLLKEIYNALADENISIPFPQMDVYLKRS